MATDAQRIAARLRDLVVAAGGLASQAELARHWDVNRARARQVVTTPGFPEPIDRIGGREVWAIAEVDEWRANRPSPGRPTTTTDRYREGDEIPVTGQWGLADAQGRSGGVVHQLTAGDRFPGAQDGYTWVLRRTTRGEIPPIRPLAERRGRAPRRR